MPRRNNGFRGIESVVAYWSERVDEMNLGCDWDEAHNRCWRCGAERKLQRCHIVAKQFGGGDEDSNLVALCAICHDEAPDVTDPAAMWGWIERTRSMLHGTLRTERALEICKQKGVDVSKCDIEKLKRLLPGTVGLHNHQNGGGPFVKAESYAWVIEQACKPDDPTPQPAQSPLAAQ